MVFKGRICCNKNTTCTAADSLGERFVWESQTGWAIEAFGAAWNNCTAPIHHHISHIIKSYMTVIKTLRKVARKATWCYSPPLPSTWVLEVIYNLDFQHFCHCLCHYLSVQKIKRHFLHEREYLCVNDEFMHLTSWLQVLVLKPYGSIWLTMLYNVTHWTEIFSLM